VDDEFTKSLVLAKALNTDNGLLPILRTKMNLLAQMWWHEDEFGTADVIGFRPGP
jgi:hypothetical protein